MTKLVVLAYDGIINPATRLRISQFIPSLEAAGVSVKPFYIPYSDGVRRSWTFRQLIEAVRESDVVFVQRTLFWWLIPLLRLTGRPYIFDVDDAIHVIRQSQYEAARVPSTLVHRAVVLYRKLVRGGRYFSSRKSLFDAAIRHASGVIVGNDYLAEYVMKRTTRMITLPTSVAINNFPVRDHGSSDPVRIGWIGVPSNLIHLRLLDSVFAEINRRYDGQVKLVIVSNRGLSDLPITTEFVPWSLEGESETTASFDMGIMPLMDDLFSRGKCSFKAIYCMAHGLPVVISPVGMNTKLIEHGVNGFLADTDDDWIKALCALVDDPALRVRLGQAARQTIEREYSAEKIFQQLHKMIGDVARK